MSAFENSSSKVVSVVIGSNVRFPNQSFPTSQKPLAHFPAILFDLEVNDVKENETTSWDNVIQQWILLLLLGVLRKGGKSTRGCGSVYVGMGHHWHQTAAMCSHRLMNHGTMPCRHLVKLNHGSLQSSPPPRMKDMDHLSSWIASSAAALRGVRGLTP